MSILAAIGGEHEQDRIVEVGHELALAYEDELVVLHVMEQEQFEEIRDSKDVSSTLLIPGRGEEVTGLAYRTPKQSPSKYNIEDAMSDAEGIAHDCVSRTLNDKSNPQITTKGRVGKPATEIVEEAESLDARFIVVGGRKRTPVGKAIFGSVSQAVILNSERPVVTISRAR